MKLARPRPKAGCTIRNTADGCSILIDKPGVTVIASAGRHQLRGRGGLVEKRMTIECREAGITITVEKSGLTIK